jgi:hypothetical protein
VQQGPPWNGVEAVGRGAEGVCECEAALLLQATSLSRSNCIICTVIAAQMDADSNARKLKESATIWLREKQQDLQARFRCIVSGFWALRWQPWKWLPFANLFYDLLLDEPPSAVNVERLLNVYGLLTALLLGSVFGVMGSVDMEEMLEADRMCWFDPTRESTGYLEAIHWFRFGNQWSWRVFFMFNMSVITISAALFCTVIVFMAFSSHDFESDSRSFRAWWFWGRWTVAFIFASTAVGCYLSFILFTWIAQLKFPYACPKPRPTSRDDIEHHELKFSWPEDSYRQMWEDAGGTEDILKEGILYPVLIVSILLSLASANRYRVALQPEPAQEEEKQQLKLLPPTGEDYSATPKIAAHPLPPVAQ